jgi:hypothetical protein
MPKDAGKLAERSISFVQRIGDPVPISQERSDGSDEIAFDPASR